MEVVFPTVMLCFALAAGKVLISHQCFGVCWAVLEPSVLPLQCSTLTGRLGWARPWEGTEPGDTANSHSLWGYSMPYDVCSAIKTKRREERRRGHLFYCVSVCLQEQLLHVTKPGFLGSRGTSPVDGKRRMNLLFLCFHACPLLLLYYTAYFSWSTRVFFIFFSSLCPAEKGSGRPALRAPDI